MYSAILIAHSWLRWAALAALVVTVARAMGGWRGRRPWTPSDDRAGLLSTISLDLQLLLGLLLYFIVSPTMDNLRLIENPMRESAVRFWLLEHPFGMFVALVLAHVGRVRIRKAADARRKHRLALIFFGLALVVIAVSLPWPGTATGRPLFRLP